ncbi:hypothetical protein SAMN02745248_00036 [Hathewaya proteolytica DSM 3090]|uniref:Aminoacetone oxidase family FAD-binding enzyme n=1 Tax=Hathewaya proteolytica DSM 3090 TaxID=1121331 RepID=A0A1M6J3X2_9CLOT|nr:NAD(P)/FAD-dependent oxidoreductase [Hathewaya proteolytica]SHJ41430.1 hypothetical protein SAMN02745248_00036 [Hathewaya proteolytica DSM 3090]
MSNIIIIGGGPAGIMAAIKASENHRVTLIEQNEKLGKKLYITGKGRCNVTNNADIGSFFDNIPKNPHFLYSAFYSFTNEDVKNFFESSGVKLKVERGERVFPCSDKSSDIIKALETKLREKHVNVLLNSRVSEMIIRDSKVLGIKMSSGEILKADSFIIATGGASYPQTGSTGDGYIFAKKCNHNVVDAVPSLIPMVCSEEWIDSLQGISLKNVTLTLKQNGKILFQDFGEMLFTHYGISGPIVLSGSARIPLSTVKKGLNAYIDLKPALSYDELDLRIQRDFKKFINKDFKNSLNELLPSKLIDRVIYLTGIPEDKKINSITKEERKKLVEILKGFPLTIVNYRPIAEAIITSGGVDTKEIDPSTMKSKFMDNLYFAGEILDTHGYTGGFNLQIAFSTGFLAGEKVK